MFACVYERERWSSSHHAADHLSDVCEVLCWFLTNWLVVSLTHFHPSLSRLLSYVLPLFLLPQFTLRTFWLTPLGSCCTFLFSPIKRTVFLPMQTGAQLGLPLLWSVQAGFVLIVCPCRLQVIITQHHHHLSGPPHVIWQVWRLGLNTGSRSNSKLSH